MAMFTRIVLAASIAASALVSPASAGLLDKFIQHKSFPECHDAKVLRRIVKRFNNAQDYHTQPDIFIADITRVRERQVNRPHDDLREVNRRYCRGHAQMSDGTHPTLFYLIESGTGFAGNGFNVEYCMSKYDRWNEFDGSCRVLNY